MLNDAAWAAERRALDAAAQEAANASEGARYGRRRHAQAARVDERDRTRMTPEQWKQLGLGQCVIEWIDSDGDHWAHGDSDGVWLRAMELPIECPVWINGYRITRLTDAELRALADRIASGAE